jgi:hypothetical protein
MKQLQLDDAVKVIEVSRPERMLDAQSKTAMLTIATLADFYRLGEDWHPLHYWRQWQHGKRVNEVSHFGEYTTMQGDVLAVCPMESNAVVCQVQVVEIRMVDCSALTEREVRELGYTSRADYDTHWADMAPDSPRGWFMRVMLVPDEDGLLH